MAWSPPRLQARASRRDNLVKSKIPTSKQLGAPNLAERGASIAEDEDPESAERQGGRVVAATDYMRLSADQIGPYVRDRYKVLGTDRFGRSDCRQKLCHFFEMERHLVGV